MNALSRFLCRGVGVIAALLGLSMQAALASMVSVSISQLMITPGAGTLVIDPWTANASAVAHNSLGEVDGSFHPGPLLANASSSIGFADASGHASAADLLASASGNIDLIPGSAADTTALGALFTRFMITGGTGSVDVKFSMQVDGHQAGSTGAFGHVDINSLIATLELDGASVLFLHNPITAGANASFDVTTSTTLSATVSLNFDTEYQLFALADGELGEGETPEPGTAALVLAAAVGSTLARLQARRSRAGVRHAHA
ncbi:hypothetical protein HLB44_17915 [Aquincola sp. S2]|uniref:PEP-CTERM protein-sorting domain-containing protein n=1 Tax=Pseudaquabacterium terrae TaxID=2732868 RepID=A0ABX2EJT9_9BURK|nr:hypothetical protein [Aquabacterium terrae]NRF68873.1 hypothetical protein [Aquabacterium terrae]